jgi:phosphatidate cytidylyltransferase
MNDPQPLPSETSRLGADFRLRLVVGAVLAIAAVGFTLLGGLWFELFWGAAFAAVAYEWQSIVEAQRPVLRIAAAVLAAIVSVILSVTLGPVSALMFAFLAAVAVAWLGAQENGRFSFLSGAGVLYASVPAAVLVWIEVAPVYALATIVFVFAVVWSADIGAFVAGRLLGGPKLWPRISPKKTWSGFAGGTLAGTVLPLLAVALTGVLPSLWLAAVAAFLAVVSAAGDLFESWLKRKFDVKDSSKLVPGHGGVMDRLDGFIAVLLALGAISAATGMSPAEAIFGS